MLEKAYNPQGTEDRIYKMWEDSGAFIADATSDKEPFTIALPPPNATGTLHLGHAVMLALEDIFTRFARMNGKETLWLPGTDHAAIATENVVIKKLKTEGMKDPRKELGREKLVEKIAEFVAGSQGTIRSQMRKMGASCDWSRERYTFEPALNRTVNEVFKKMYDDGLMYRGHRIVNWDPKLQTTVSDDELEYKEETALFYTFQYGPFQISTSRPETKFGDKYVVMHPDDKRYAKYKHGDTFDAEWINGPVKATVIKDESVDPEFGTGVMTITPWHDTTDFEIAERHGLEKEQVIGYDGLLLEIAGEFAGMTIEDARPGIVEKLQGKGLVVSVKEDYVHNKALNSRGGGTIEPQIKLQWFVDVNKKVVQWKKQTMSLKEVMHDVVHHGDIEIIPDRFNKTYFHWIDNLRDWCVSRQIWWGHRIPVWYCKNCDMKVNKGLTTRFFDGREPIHSPDAEVRYFVHDIPRYIGSESQRKCQQCGSADSLEQDNDTLDTWFSSALWTWSTLIDPKLTEDFSLSLEDMLKQSPDFQKFHPTTVMETGYDLIFFWVARMILMTTYATGQVPFKTVYFHGMVRTKEGKKMSKSDPKTAIDPLEIIPTYGADALRLSMIVGQSPGADTKLYDEKIAGYRNFINKLWNASRFVLMECEKAGVKPEDVKDSEAVSDEDKALNHELALLIDDATRGITEYRLSETGERLYAFTWDFFCDWYLELSKGQPNPALLVTTMRTILTLLHPYCPFVTEELWAQFKPKKAGMLLKTSWPEAQKASFAIERANFQKVIDTIVDIRKVKVDYDTETGQGVTVTIASSEHQTLTRQLENIRRLVRMKDATIAIEPIGSDGKSGITVDVPGFDSAAAKARLQKEQESLEKFMKGIEVKLGNEQFVARAQPAVVEQERAKLADAQEKLAKVAERLKGL